MISLITQKQSFRQSLSYFRETAYKNKLSSIMTRIMKNIVKPQLDYISMIMAKSHECVSIKLSGHIRGYGKTVQEKVH